MDQRESETKRRACRYSGLHRVPSARDPRTFPFPGQGVSENLVITLIECLIEGGGIDILFTNCLPCWLAHMYTQTSWSASLARPRFQTVNFFYLSYYDEILICTHHKASLTVLRSLSQMEAEVEVHRLIS